MPSCTPTLPELAGRAAAAPPRSLLWEHAGRKAEGARGLLAAHTAQRASVPEGATRSGVRAGSGPSLFGLELLALVLRPGEDALVEQQVRAGGQHLLQAGLADSVVGNPQPLVTG